MKKLLSAALALSMGLTLVGVLAGCDNGNEPEGPTDAEALATAMAGIKALYIDKYSNTTTPSDYEVAGQYPVNGTYCTITWTVNVTEGVTVKEMDATTKMVTIDVNEKTTEAIEYELTASISYNELTETYTFKNLKVPAYNLNSHDDFVHAAKGDKLRIAGTVIGFAKKGDGASNNTIFVQDEDGGYYVYSLSGGELPEGIAIGKKLTVSGEYDLYNGLHELKNATVEKVEAGTAIEPTDITDLVKAAKDTKDTALVAMQSSLVTIKGVTICKVSTDASYYDFKLGEVSSYLRISSSDCPTNAANQETIKKAHADNLGKTATVTGIVSVYGGAFYIVPVSGDAFKDFAESNATPAEKVAEEKATVTLTNKIASKDDITLPTPATYKDVEFTWESDNTDVLTIKDGKINVTLPEAETKVKITLTLKCGSEEDTKTFDITVSPAKEFAEGNYMFSIQLLEKKMYLKGTITGNYADLTENAAEAATVTVEKSGAGYTMKIGGKYFELVASGKYANPKLLDTATTSVWTYDNNLEVFTWTVADGDAAGTYYLGTYLNANNNTIRESIGSSKTSYISGTEASKVGVSQFVLVAEKKVTGTYKFSIQLLEKKMYLKGTITGNYADLTENAEEAAAVVVETAEGGYRLKIGEKYFELVASGKYANPKLLDTATTSVWTYDNNLGVFTWTVADGDAAGTYYLGTYLNSKDNTIRESIGSSKTSYISGTEASKVGVSQFVLVAGESVAEAETPETPVVGIDGWKKVTNASDLKAGDTIILTYGGYAMGAVSDNGKFRTAVSYDGTTVSDKVVIITLEAASEGKFYLKVADGYLTSPTTKENTLYTKAEKDAEGASEWTITVDADGNAVLTPAKADDAKRVLQFNSNSGQERFCCYLGTQQSIVIYVQSTNS